jgi:dihydroorotase
MTKELTLTRPDDWHVHLRDGAVLPDVLAHTATRFARAIVMPNLSPAVTTTEAALAYRERILGALPPGADFQPLMTLYLTDTLGREEIIKAAGSGHVCAVKLYPAGATTNSQDGVTDIHRVYPTLEAMQINQLPLLVHGEVVDPDVDVFDREKVFIDRVLSKLHADFPELRLVFEHITTAEAVQFVESTDARVGATITPHHLLLNRNAMFHGGLRPHHYCLPVLKRERHRRALVEAAVSGNPKFFLGTDSAPHARSAKESACGCAGIYSAHAALELYAELFESVEALDRLEAFASFHGPDFYGLPRNAQQITLHKLAWEVPGEMRFGRERLVPLRAGDAVSWSLATQSA